MTPAARRFGAACAAGAALALVAFVWILVTRPGGFFGRTPFGLGAFYDAQARALFHGHWDAGPTAFSLERFHIGGRYYMYFGPWPSLLRSPVLLVTDALDGRLTSTSLVLAAVTLFAGTGRLLWIVRGLFDRGDPSRRELVAIGGLVFLIGCGSSVIFLSGSAWVYDEAILWGAAWAVWGLAATMDYLRGRSRAALVLATVFTTLAALSRTTSGAVGIVLLGSLLLVRVSQVPRGPRLRAAASWIARVTGLDHRLDGRPVWSLGLAVFTPVVAYAAVNFARFGSMYAVPWNK